MSWEEIDTERFLDDGIIDKAGLSLEAMVKQCAQKKIGNPGYTEFINQFQKALSGCAKEDFLMEADMYFENVELGFLDYSKLQSGDYTSQAYEFIQSLVCDAISKIKSEYEDEFKRKPYLQEVMAAFSRVAVGRPEFYFNVGEHLPLTYIKAIQKPV
jgi:hypothetical protein